MEFNGLSSALWLNLFNSEVGTPGVCALTCRTSFPEMMGGKLIFSAAACDSEPIGGSTDCELSMALAMPAPTSESLCVCQPKERLQNPRLARVVASAIVLSFLFIGRMTMRVVF